MFIKVLTDMYPYAVVSVSDLLFAHLLIVAIVPACVEGPMPKHPYFFCYDVFMHCFRSLVQGLRVPARSN